MADALVHPTYYDAFANVCLEAMAAGLPVLSSRNAGVSELMHNVEGCVLIDMPIPAQELADKIGQLIELSMPSAIAASQRKTAALFDKQDNLQKIEVLYSQCLALKQTCPN